MENKDFIIENGVLVRYTGNDANVVIPDSVKEIEVCAFENCSSLTSITIPDSVTIIGEYAFELCDNLKYNIYENCKYLGNEKNPYHILIEPVSKKQKQIIINNQTKIIYHSAFENCPSLTSVTIPDGVTIIGTYAFYGCSSLTSITIPDSVTKIGDYAFSICEKLKSITIPDSVTIIGELAFVGCPSLTSITIPDSVKEIGWSAFKDCKCEIHFSSQEQCDKLKGWKSDFKGEIVIDNRD